MKKRGPSANGKEDTDRKKKKKEGKECQQEVVRNGWTVIGWGKKHIYIIFIYRHMTHGYNKFTGKYKIVIHCSGNRS